MKRLSLLLLTLALTLAFVLSSCGPEVPTPCIDHVDANGDVLCDGCGFELPPPCETHTDSDMNSVCDLCCATISYITVAKALELCGEAGNVTAERYYVLATIDSITDAGYGSMVVSDETGSISVYGTYSPDGNLRFSQISPVPTKGDTVTLHCILQNFNGTKEVKNARLVGFTDNSGIFDSSEYTTATVKEAREKDKGSLVIVEGVVAAITYSNGMKPAGVILVDGTDSIYVYDATLAGSVSKGNKIKIAAEKDYWILEDEQANAEKYGYQGCNQLTNAYVLTNDGANNSFDKSWITETTVMDILDLPVTEDITTQLYKVTALVVKQNMPGFVNYYIDDLDGVTGTYVYTQCNGSDFAWLDQYDGKICTVYLTALNAKSTATGCVFRFLPVAVEEEKDFSFADASVPEHVIKYYAAKQLSESYTGDPALELITSVSSELLGFTDAAVSYTSSDTSIISFTADGDKVIMNCPGFGTATVTVTVTYQGVSATKDIEITVNEPINIDAITVGEAIAAAKGTEVTVKGIVAASLVNKVGFYLIDESGVIAVMANSGMFESINIGDEIIIKGKRTSNDEGTQQYIDITSGEILANLYGNNTIPTSSFVTGDITELFGSTDTTKVYITKGVIKKDVQRFYTNYYIGTPDNPDNNVQIYASGESELLWLDAFLGEEVTLELIMCNWNGKAYKIAVISVVTDDGKVYSASNFNKYGK